MNKIDWVQCDPRERWAIVERGEEHKSRYENVTNASLERLRWVVSDLLTEGQGMIVLPSHYANSWAWSRDR